MGIVIIIPNADFSDVAVDVIPVTPQEPTEYITLSGAGKSSDFTEGQYYIGNNVSHPSEICIKGSGDNYELANLQSGTILKYNGFYYIINSNTPPFYLPYYNCKNVSNFQEGAFIYNNGVISENNESQFLTSFRRQVVSVKNGETLIYNFIGGNNAKVLCVKNKNNEVTVVDGRTDANGPDYSIQSWTNNTGDEVSAYLSLPTTVSQYSFIAKSIDV